MALKCCWQDLGLSAFFIYDTIPITVLLLDLSVVLAGDSGVKVRGGYARAKDVAPALTRLFGCVLLAPEKAPLDLFIHQLHCLQQSTCWHNFLSPGPCSHRVFCDS